MSATFADYIPPQQQEELLQIASVDPQHGFDPWLRTLKQIESSGGKDTRMSPKGAVGPLQMMPVAFQEMGGDYERGKVDPIYAEEIGTSYAKKIFKEFGVRDPRLASAAYHSGPTRVRRLLRDAPQDLDGDGLVDYVASQLGPEGRGHVGKTDKLMKLRNVDKEPRTGVEAVYNPDTGTFESGGFGTRPSMERAKPSFKDADPKIPGNQFLSFLKQAGVETAGVADLILSLPGFAAGVVGSVGGAAMRLASGESPRTAYKSAGEVGMQLADKFSNPLQKVFSMFKGGEEAYGEAKSVQAMHAFTEAVKRGDQYLHDITGGKVPEGAFEMFVNTSMLGAIGAPKAVKFAREDAARGQPLYQRRATDRPGVELIEPPKFSDFKPAERKLRDEFAEFDAEIKAAAENVNAQVTRDKVKRGLGLAVGVPAAAGVGVAVGEAAYDFVDKRRFPPQPPQERSPEPGFTPDNTMLAIGDSAPGFAAMAPALLAAGWVKKPGGMWHPEAVERLSQPLAGSLTGLRNVVEGNPRHMERLLAEDNLKPEFQKALPLVQWSEKSIRNYLNRYAGTERDPLKDIEIPFEQGTKRWEDLTDAAIGNLPVKKFTQLDPVSGTRENFEGAFKAKPDEPVFGLKGNSVFRSATNHNTDALQRYLSHVGDYLRQNVPPEKLAQYDLVRAVKETAANDARVAKEMEKAAAASTKDLPVYKDYTTQNPGTLPGMKWVELKMPEGELTTEQSKQVRRMTEEEKSKYSNDSGNAGTDYDLKRGDWYVALGSDGKLIKNTYTGDVAIAPSAREAHLAGQLAQEGNQLGHCVGGYCNQVASGESRIFSLRDAKGKSHVTVEVDPQGTPGWWEKKILAKLTPEQQVAANNLVNKAAYGEGISWAEAAKKVAPELDHTPEQSILQIKGKQNRAPVAEYLPYVQDFVRAGKWGEVGDLGNTGMGKARQVANESNMMRTSDVAPEIYNKYDSDFRLITDKEFQNELKARYQSDWSVMQGESFDTYAIYDKNLKRVSPNFTTIDYARDWLSDARSNTKDKGPRNQQGSANLDLVKAMAVAGVGATIGMAATDDEKRILGALTGATGALGLLALGRSKRTGKEKSVPEILDYGLGMISTRLRNASEPLRFRAIQYERRVLEGINENFNRGENFVRGYNDIPKAQRTALDLAIDNNNTAAVLKIARDSGNVKLHNGYIEARKILNEMGAKLKESGRLSGLRSEFFPRVVLDVAGLLKALPNSVRNPIEKALHKAEQESMSVSQQSLSQIEESIIINRMLQKWKEQAGQPGFAKPREVEQVTQALLPFYAKPPEAFHSYIAAGVRELEKIKFFGRDLAEKTKGNQTYLDTDTSIGNVVRQEIKEGKLTSQQLLELESILKSRFTQGEKAPGWLTQDAMNVGYTALLSNLGSAILNMTDLGVTAYSQGMKPTLAHLINKLTGRTKINVDDFGLTNHIADEFVSTRTSAKLLNTGMKLAGFAALDRIAKNLQTGAAQSKFEMQARTPAGIAEIKKKYGESLGEEFPQLIEDLRAKKGKDSELVRSVVFAELSDVQPLTRMEATQAGLDNPNGRIFYMLKRYMLKQVDLMRRDAWNEIKKGDAASIARGAGNLARYGVIMGLAGYPILAVTNWIMGRQSEITSGDLFMNVLKTFGWSEYIMDKIKKGETVDAAMGVVAPPYKIMDEILRLDPKAVRYIPIVGKIIESRYMGGAERYDASKAWRDISKDIPIGEVQKANRYRADRANLYRTYQSGNTEKFERDLSRLKSTYGLSEKQINGVRRTAQLPEDVRRFKMLPSAQQETVLRASSPERKARLLQHSRKEVRRKFYQ